MDMLYNATNIHLSPFHSLEIKRLTQAEQRNCKRDVGLSRGYARGISILEGLIWREDGSEMKKDR
jgi:hypothetical protein